MTQTTLNLMELLSSFISSGSIPNSRYNDIKASLNVEMERASRKAREEILNLRAEAPDNSELTNLYYALPDYPHQVKGFSKKLSSYSSVPPMVKVLVEDFLLVAKLLETAKPLIQKGKAQSLLPSSKPARTLENTGTCPICGKNVKLSPCGLLVSHGYTREEGYHTADCFGRGYEPLEISYIALENFICMVESYKAKEELFLFQLERNEIKRIYSHQFKKHISEGEAGWSLTLSRATQKTKANVNTAELEIRMRKEQVANWKPTALPG
jgi:hypothetical protein